MKILIINDYGFETGGVATYIFNLKEQLKRNGHIAKILSSDAYPEKKHFSDYEFRGINENSQLRVFPYIFNLRAWIKFRKILKEFKPDVIHINNIYYHSSPSILVPLKNIPTLMTLHSYEIICPAGTLIFPSLKPCKNSFGKNCIRCIGKMRYYPEKIKRIILKRLLKNIDMFIVPSNHIKKELKKRGFDSIKRTYNGIKPLKYSKIEKNNNLLYVGRLSKEKGVKYLLKAMPMTIKKLPKVHLDIVGDGPEKDNLINLTKKLKLEKNVTFIGQIPNKKIEKYYKKSSIVIIPSICPESFSLVGIEAMSVGRSVVASNVGAIPEWLEDEKTGYLVEPKNPKQIAEKVIKLLSNRKLMEKMGRNAREKAEKEFDIKKHVGKIEKVYKEVIEKYRR